MAKKKNAGKKQVKRSNKKSLKEKIEEHPITAILTFITVLVGAPTAIVVFRNEFKDAWDDYVPPKPSIVLNEIDYANSQSIYQNQPLIIKQNETVVPANEKDYVIDSWDRLCNYYVQNALITNKNISNDIVLTKFNIYIENIVVDYSPILEVYTDCFYDNTIKIDLLNKGWSDISTVDITLKDEKGILNFSKYNKYIDKLEYGTCDTIDIQLDMGNFKYLTNYGDCEYPLYLEVRYGESDDVLLYKTRCVVRVEGSEVCIPNTGWGYGPSQNAYGICVDTNKSSFKFSQPIQEVITAGEALELPVFFFPDRSCEFDYYIEFEVSNEGKNQKIKTDLKHVKYRVDSLADTSKFDASKLTELKAWKEEVAVVSYPYSTEWEWYDDLHD